VADGELLMRAAGMTGGGVGVIAGSVAAELIIPGRYSEGQITESSLCPDVPPVRIFKRFTRCLSKSNLCVFSSLCFSARLSRPFNVLYPDGFPPPTRRPSLLTSSDESTASQESIPDLLRMLQTNLR